MQGSKRIILRTHSFYFLLFSLFFSLAVCLSVTWPMAADKWIVFGRSLCEFMFVMCVLSCIFNDYRTLLLFHIRRHYVSYIPSFLLLHVWCSDCRILWTQVHYWLVSSSSWTSILIVCSKCFTSNHFRHFRHLGTHKYRAI